MHENWSGSERMRRKIYREIVLTNVRPLGEFCCNIRVEPIERGDEKDEPLS